jgi:hypothetical protein
MVTYSQNQSRYNQTARGAAAQKRKAAATTKKTTTSYNPLGGETDRTGYVAGSINKPQSGIGGHSSVGAPYAGATQQYNARTGQYYWGGGNDTTTSPALPPWSPPGGPGGGGGYGGGGGGGGGGGAPPIDTGSIMALLGRRPQQQTWQDYQWQDVDLPDYQAQEFYAFDPTQYNQARTGLQQGIAADTATGNQAYADANTELSQYQNPFANRAYTQNQPMDAAMQRMMQANGATADQATTNQGVQADAAFGNVLALLGGAAQNNQASSLRALGGDQRRFQESLANQGRNMGLGIDMAQARAQEQYNKDKWQYGVEVADRKYQATMQEIMANNQGRNQVGMANNQGLNQTNQANVQGGNEFDANALQTLIQLISGGAAIDPALLQQYISGGVAAPAA